MHPEGYHIVPTVSLWSLDHVKLSSLQSPAQFVVYGRRSESIIWIMRHYIPRTFINFPSKSNIAVPICFGTFSSSSMASCFISWVFYYRLARMVSKLGTSQTLEKTSWQLNSVNFLDNDSTDFTKSRQGVQISEKGKLDVWRLKTLREVAIDVYT